MSFIDRYRAAGLHRNPFSAEAIQSSTVFLDRGLPGSVPANAHCLVQVIGPSGYGKSTHLRHWIRRHDAQCHYVPRTPYRERWTLPTADDNSILFGDEIDRMPIALRHVWFRRAAQSSATLIIGTHIDLAGAGRRAGFSRVETYELRPLTARELDAFVEIRMASESIDGRHPRLSRNERAEILRSTGGVPRLVEIACHGLIARKVDLLTATTI